MKRTALCAITVAALLAFPASAAPAASATPPQPSGASSSRLLDLERWLQLRLEKLTSPSGTDGSGKVSPRPRYDTQTCDPTRTKCPIG